MNTYTSTAPALLRRLGLREQTRDNGFSLIEIIVVVAIVGIIVAVVVPMFFGYQDNARQSLVEATAHRALTAAETAQGTDSDVEAAVEQISIESADTTVTLIAGADSRHHRDLCVQAVHVGSADNTATAGDNCPSESEYTGPAFEPVTNLTCADNEAGQAVISWNAPAGLDEEIYYELDVHAVEQEHLWVAHVDGDSTAFSDWGQFDGLYQNSDYEVRVKPHGVEGGSSELVIEQVVRLRADTATEMSCR